MCKRIVSLVLCAILAVSMTACSRGNTDNGEKVSLKVWGAQEDQALLKRMIAEFEDENDDIDYDITLGVVGTKDAQAKILEDPAAAADVFVFSDDQLLDLVNAGALYEITRNKDSIKEDSLAGAFDAACVGDSLYGYPMTADNGYFLYYDKSVVSEQDAQSLDKLLAACNKAGKKFYMDISNGWYAASFFLAAGCSVGLDEKGKQTCNFNNSDGVKAGEAIKALCADAAFVTGDDAIFTGGMGDTIAAGVSGTWNAAAVSERLGKNYAATKLPTATIGGEQLQLKSYAGYKILGVNSGTKQPLEAMKLAEWLTNEDNQLLRFEERELGPANAEAAQSDKVKNNIALAALAKQNEFGVSQRGIKSTFWSPVEAFGTAMETKDYSKSVQALLDSMVADITAQ